MNWYTEIENNIDDKDGSLIKSEMICEAIFNLLTASEIAFVLILYDCADIETIIKRAGIKERAYYRMIERIRVKLSPYLLDMRFLNPSDGECDIGTSGQNKDGQIGGNE